MWRSTTNILFFLMVICAVSFSNSTLAYDDLLADDPTPSIELGARVFDARCTICHGAQGMGEGNLAIRIKDYPDTNLITNDKTQNIDDIRYAIIFGGAKGKLSKYMPPMGSDLSWTETESVAMFVELLKTTPSKATALLAKTKVHEKPTKKEGRRIFKNRCVLCHGVDGEGNGRMARIIKSPPPANLVKSTLSEDALVQIIIGGGIAANKSPQMPPWGDQLTLPEIRSVVLYVQSLR